MRRRRRPAYPVGRGAITVVFGHRAAYPEFHAALLHRAGHGAAPVSRPRTREPPGERPQGRSMVTVLVNGLLGDIPRPSQKDHARGYGRSLVPA